MSREIKFRGWHNGRQEMILPPSPHSSRLGPYLMSLNGHCYINGKYQDIEWMQYTGLTDKNGVEIYEGDIVRHWISHAPRKEPMIVVWDHIGALFRMKQPYSDSGVSWAVYRSDLKVEIIGNIYENPELIE